MKSASQFVKVLSLLLLLCIGAFTLEYLIMCLTFLPARIFWHWSNSLVEPQPVWAAMRVALGQPLYIDYSKQMPVVPLTFGSLTYLFPGFISRFMELADARSVTRILRIIATVGFACSLLLTMIIAKQQKAKIWFVVLAPVAIFWLPYACDWTAKAFPDFPAVAFSLAGWAYIRQSGDDKKLESRKFVAAVLWLIAWHFKPIVTVGISGYVGEVAWAYLFGQSGQVKLLNKLKPILYFICLALGSSILAVYLTNGLWLKHIVGTTGAQSWTGSNLPFMLTLAQEIWFLPIFMICACMLLKTFPFAAGLLVESVLVCLLLLKEGSNVNYLIGTAFLFSLMASQWLQSFRLLDLKHTVLAMPFLTAIALMLFINRRSSEVFIREMPAVSKEEVSAVATWINPDREQNLCLDSYFALVYDLPCPYMDGFHANILEQSHVYSFGKISTDIRNSKYPVVIGNTFMLVQPPVIFSPMIPLSISKAIIEGSRPVYRGSFLQVVTTQKLPASSKD